MAGVLEELDLDGAFAGGQVDVDADGTVGAVAPFVEHDLVVDEDAGTVVHAQEEAVDAGFEVDAPLPASGEVVHRQVNGRAALHPGEVDRRLVTNEDGVALQFAVAEVFALPAAESLFAVPPETHECDAGALEILEPDRMAAGAEGDIDRIGARGAFFPLIEDEHAVDEEAEAVVDFDAEAIDAGIEAQCTAPADTVMIGAEDGIGRAFTPVKKDDQIVACQDRRARQIGVVPVFAEPVGDDQRRGSRYRRNRGRVCGRGNRRRCGCGRCRRGGGRRLRFGCGVCGRGLRRDCRVGQVNGVASFAGAEERGCLQAAVGGVSENCMIAVLEPARADGVEEAGADVAFGVGGAGGQDSATAALVAQGDQDEAAGGPAFADDLHIDAGRA